MLRGFIWNYLSGAYADLQLKESYRLLVMKVCTSLRVYMKVWCVHEGVVCAWRCGVCMKVWCVHEGVCMEVWCVHEGVVCA